MSITATVSDKGQATLPKRCGIRLSIADDASQAAKARQVFDASAERDDRIWVNDTVLVELA